MTDKLEQEAREAAAKLADSCTNHRANFVLGYLAAATARDKELVQLRETVDQLLTIVEELCAKIEALEASSPKAGAVPVDEIRECARECRNTWPEEGIADDARFVESWLAGLEGKSHA